MIAADLLSPGTGLIVYQAIGFLILLFLLGKFAWKPILASLKEREQSIEGALLAAEQAKKDMTKLQQANEQLLKDARAERDSLLKEAVATANSIKEEAKEETSKITAKMMEDARLAIENEKKAALAEVKTTVAELSLQITEKILRKELADKKAQESLVDEYIKELNLN
ncbi:ATP synthase F0 subcomplex B subunit [Roseivirga pacifica]|uniref:ATP synthase subunit b n=1 Tax=Roseivirga pacifica TaxID=1267423 RepID=A0A1I0N3C5_9BACT|nr:F0F1 ATP synthase subunit B [Roseivirga pacifica]MCO6359391.1 F0F1 ATP synthase subunit B [Roseivirga pacifica]MCO6366761.1 F0F1 ATP synthase subunit B [Roseivirga pacifica]MCO6370707.1 F0F1 ATP synthase subunit B [Roseivirga pacifica]MCO6374417.1 F0F1 ATP synthase subunit B [Roseivirga pacifica]MCO6379676.1 F0F1 ATP synthase subunit B [Roseivirga pacifica]